MIETQPSNVQKIGRVVGQVIFCLQMLSLKLNPFTAHVAPDNIRNDGTYMVLADTPAETKVMMNDLFENMSINPFGGLNENNATVKARELEEKARQSKAPLN